MVLVSAAAMGLVGVYAMGVVSGAVVVRGRVCVRSAQKEVGKWFRKVAEEKAVGGAKCDHPAVVALMMKWREE